MGLMPKARFILTGSRAINRDLRAEIHFYGKKLDTLGLVYFCSPKMPAPYPDVLFFCLYTAAVLTNKKISSSVAQRIMRNLQIGGEWEKVFDNKDKRLFDMPVKTGDYLGITKSVIRSQMMIDIKNDNKNEEIKTDKNTGIKIHFQFGTSGFGIFSNGRFFEICAENSVYALLEKAYRQNIVKPEAVELLWQAAGAFGKVELGSALHSSNRVESAKEIYERVCSFN